MKELHLLCIYLTLSYLSFLLWKWMFHMSFQDWSMDDGYMDVSQDWKKLKQHWNAIGSNWTDCKRTLFWVTAWDGRFVLQGTIRPWDAPWGLNNSPGKDFFSWQDRHNHLFRLKRLLQIPCPLANRRLSCRCWALCLQLHQWLFRYELLLNAVVQAWFHEAILLHLSFVFAGAIYLWLIFTVPYFNGIGSS